jgi:hypothetical protein
VFVLAATTLLPFLITFVTFGGRRGDLVRTASIREGVVALARGLVAGRPKMRRALAGAEDTACTALPAVTFRRLSQAAPRHHRSVRQSKNLYYGSMCTG